MRKTNIHMTDNDELAKRVHVDISFDNGTAVDPFQTAEQKLAVRMLYQLLHEPEKVFFTN